MLCPQGAHSPVPGNVPLAHIMKSYSTRKADLSSFLRKMKELTVSCEKKPDKPGEVTVVHILSQPKVMRTYEGLRA